MASSPSCSSTSPSTSTNTTATDLQEADALSDDSGVDVKPQCRKPHEKFLKFAQEPETAIESSKRNKRKSSEPKKRKDVLLMKRFRWDSDDEDNVEDSREVDDVFDVIERERPSSGDSGCQVATPSTTNLSKTPEEKKKRPRQWRKPKVEKEIPVIKQEPILQTFRQSVIRKHEASSTSTILSHSSKDLSSATHLSSSGSCSLVTSHCLTGQTYVPPIVQSDPFDSAVSGSEEGSDKSNRTNRSVGRPRNYKSMSRERRIEANARERTRVHTISAAFEDLRRAVPAYAHNQKLSKLAILRIASAYIVALACLSEQDYHEEQSKLVLEECVERCTKTIQAEGRSRRRTSKEMSYALPIVEPKELLKVMDMLADASKLVIRINHRKVIVKNNVVKKKINVGNFLK
ncbi:protein atonal homolog 8 [Nephila pilipes]|uniref:Protein atonal homolog 8 n=1 Tax=Nephila pilipes TaxID=299642 RepID=A0A8X6NZV0_NEPPI|nr:protein atonal homolog 8 [Nephila pilipes]